MTKKIGRGKRHNTFTDFTRSNKLACIEDIDRSKGVSAYMNVYMICCKYTYENEHKIYLRKYAYYTYCNLKKPSSPFVFQYLILKYCLSIENLNEI